MLRSTGRHGTGTPHLLLIEERLVEEVSLKMYSISSATKNIIMEVPQKIPFFTFSVALACNGISIILFLTNLL